MANPSFVRKRINNIDNPQIDTNLYRGLELKNGLRVLLVSNPSTVISSVALNVACGSLMDPEYMQGAARLCEHMLFHGNPMYPREDKFDYFLYSNGGKKEAESFGDNTLFQFSVPFGKLQRALKLFADLFIDPPFSKEILEREVSCINHDHEMRGKINYWRIRQVENSLSKSDHTFKKFDRGSMESLIERPRQKNLDPLEELRKFFREWYSANSMTLVVIGRESLDELEQILERARIGQIENKHGEKKTWTHPWESQQLQKFIKIVPVDKFTRQLKLSFPLPGHGPFYEYESKPIVYIDYLIFHGGKEGLVWQLTNRGLATKVEGGYSCIIRGFATYEFRVELTVSGLEQIHEIVDMFFRYLQVLIEANCPRRIYDELRQRGENCYRFMDKDVTRRAAGLAATLQNVDFKDVISANYLIPNFNPRLIMSVLKSLVPTRMNHFVISDTFAGERGNTVEPIYGTEIRVDTDYVRTQKYCVALNIKHELFKLPTENNYIATNFDLKPREAEAVNHPICISEDKWSRVWFQQDVEFNVPQMMTWISISTPFIARSPGISVLTNCYVECLRDYLAEQSNAHVAHLVSNVELTSHSINITVNGYDEKQPLFVRDLMKRLLDFSTSKERFQVITELVDRRLHDFTFSEPYVLCKNLVSMLLKEKFWSCEEMRSEVPYVSLGCIRRLLNDLFSTFELDIFAHGNITKQETLDMANGVRETFKVPPTKNGFSQLRERCLTRGKSFVYRHYQNIHEVSCVDAIWQIGVENNKNDAILQTLVNLILATYSQQPEAQQPGFQLWVTPRFESGTSGLEIVIQGPKNPESLMKRIESFLDKLRGDIEKMSDADCQQHIETTSQTLLRQPTKLKECSTRHWEQIASGYPDFDRHVRQSEEVKTVTKEEVLAFFDMRIAIRAEERRMFAVFVHSKKDFNGRKTRALESHLDEIKSIIDFRKDLGYFELPERAEGRQPTGVHLGRG